MSTATDIREVEASKKDDGRQPPPAPGLTREVQSLHLFDDVLLHTDDQQRHRRRLSAIVSFVSQCFFLGVLLIVPLMFTDALPQQQLFTFLIAPPPPPPPPPPASAAAAKVVKRIESDLENGRLRTPTAIPKNVQILHEDQAPDLNGEGVPGGVPGGIPGGQVGGVIGGILSATNTASVPKLALPAQPKRIRVSQGVTEGRLIQKIDPKYPPLAVAARIQGQVLLTAVIDKTGLIQNLVLVSGHPMLVPAALEAVKQWRYRPYLLNGEPEEVETTITVNFELNR